MNIWCKRAKDIDPTETAINTIKELQEIKNIITNETIKKVENVEEINKNNISIYNNYIKQLSNIYNNKTNEDFKLTYKKLYDRETKIFSSLLIKINYSKEIFDVEKYSFEIIIDNNFPNTPPYIYCTFLFLFPSINDRRNLLYSIIKNNIWIGKKNISAIDIIKNIIEKKIPNFVYRLLKNTRNNILINYGNFHENTIYNINDFFYCSHTKLYFINLYNTIINSDKKDNNNIKEEYSFYSKNYLVMTETYLLLFEINETSKNKNLSKLLLCCEIFKCDCKIINEKSESEKENDSSKVSIRWKVENDKGEKINKYFIFSVVDDFNKENAIINLLLYEEFKRRKTTLKTKYKVRISDIYKEIDYSIPLNEDNKKIIYLQQLNETIELSDYYESLYNKKLKENINEASDINNELFLLYQKIIELSSIINKMDVCSKFTDKLKLLSSKK